MDTVNVGIVRTAELAEVFVFVFVDEVEVDDVVPEFVVPVIISAVSMRR